MKQGSRLAAREVERNRGERLSHPEDTVVSAIRPLYCFKDRLDGQVTSLDQTFGRQVDGYLVEDEKCPLADIR